MALAMLLTHQREHRALAPEGSLRSVRSKIAVHAVIYPLDYAMTQDAIPALPEYNDSALDHAFAALAKQARDEATAISTADDLEAFRLRWVGRKQGRLNDVSARWLKAAPPEAKKAVGERFKTLKELVDSLLDKTAG